MKCQTQWIQIWFMAQLKLYSFLRMNRFLVSEVIPYNKTHNEQYVTRCDLIICWKLFQHRRVRQGKWDSLLMTTYKGLSIDSMDNIWMFNGLEITLVMAHVHLKLADWVFTPKAMIKRCINACMRDCVHA